MWLPRKATTEEKLTTLPLPCSTITGITCRQHKNGPFRSRFMVWSQTEGSTSVTGLSSRREPPAQFSSTSTWPKASLACCTICLTLSSSVTSVCTKRASAPASRAVASPSVASISATTTLAPSATNSLADARPMPEPAPVITATLPTSRFICPSPSYTNLLLLSPLGERNMTALPLVDFLQRSSHEHRLVALGQAFGITERRDALLIGQHADRPGPVGAPHAPIQPERIDDPQHRLPDIVVGERLVRHRAGAADLHPYVSISSQIEQLRQIGPDVGGNRRAGRLQQAEMVDHDDRIGVSLDVRQAFVQDAPAKQIDRQIIPGGGGESAVQTGMVSVLRQAVAHAYANAARAWCRRPPRHHIVNRWIGRVDRRHDPKLIRIGVIYLKRVAWIVFIGAERRYHDRAVDTDAVHRSDHFLACGGVEPVRGTGPRPAWMISIEGMNLDVDDWHDRMDLNPFEFEQLAYSAARRSRR